MKMFEIKDEKVILQYYGTKHLQLSRYLWRVGYFHV